MHHGVPNTVLCKKRKYNLEAFPRLAYETQGSQTSKNMLFIPTALQDYNQLMSPLIVSKRRPLMRVRTSSMLNRCHGFYHLAFQRINAGQYRGKAEMRKRQLCAIRFSAERGKHTELIFTTSTERCYDCKFTIRTCQIQ